MWVRDASLVDVKNVPEPVVLPTNSGVSGYGLTPTVPRVLESAGQARIPVPPLADGLSKRSQYQYRSLHAWRAAWELIGPEGMPGSAHRQTERLALVRFVVLLHP